MKLHKARVQNFRCIEDTGWVDIQSDITTLLGKNESGKSAFLEGIRAFDDEEVYNEADIRDGFEPNGIPFPITSLEFVLEEYDQKRLGRFNESFIKLDQIRFHKYYFPNDSDNAAQVIERPSTTDRALANIVNVTYLQQLLHWLQSELEDLEGSSPDFQQAELENLNGMLQDVISTEVEDPASFLNKVSDILSNVKEVRIPNYHSDAIVTGLSSEMSAVKADSDDLFRAKDIIKQSPDILYQAQEDIISDEVRVNQLDREEYRTFSNLFELTGLNLGKFQQKEFMEKAKDTSRVGDKISIEMNEYWKQKTVDVQVHYNGSKFVILLEDEILENDDPVNRGPQPPSQRSRGFRWFLSFYINFAKTTDSEEQTILLLDDPAVYLHPEGKHNWLTAIEDLAEENQILYTAHSPYLIRKEYPDRIRIVEDTKEKGTQITADFFESNETTLAPLRNALGIGLGDTPFAAKRKILVEGPSDYYILTGLAHYFAEYRNEDILGWDDVSLMVTDGAEKMVDAAKWVESENFSYALLLDNDKKGKSVKDRIDEHHDEISNSQIFLFDRPDGPDFYTEIEDMFDPRFYVDCVNEAYADLSGEFAKISIDKTNGGWGIEGVEYEGRKIASKINQIFDDRGDGDLDKKIVAKEILDRLQSGRDVKPSDVEAFKPILGKLNKAT